MSPTSVSGSYLSSLDICSKFHRCLFFCIQFSRYWSAKVSYGYGDGENRTLDPLLARQVLSQLSYAPLKSGNHLLSHIVANIVSSAVQVLTIVFGMGTGVSPGRIVTGNFLMLILQVFPDYLNI